MNLFQRRLARHLTRLREESGYSRSQVADLAGWSPPKVSRIEHGKSAPKTVDLESLLGLYRCDPDRAAALIDLARQARMRGWWVAFNDVFTGSYIAMEDGAACIRVWEAQLIPDLLQTEAYARAVITATRPHTPEAVHRQVQARMARRSVLNRDCPPSFHAVIDEAVLRRPVGGPEVMVPQYLRLLTMARQPHVTLQVLPLAAGAHAGLLGSFALLGFTDPDDADTGYAMGQAGEICLEEPDQVGRIGPLWDRLVTAAASPNDSLSMVAELAEV